MIEPIHLGLTDADFFIRNMKKKETTINGYAASMSAKATNEKTQWTKYHSPKGGHGFAAEDANAFFERIKGHKVVVVGIDNAKNGADLLIDGVPVQLKYCKNAYSSIEACFEGGTFRYYGQRIMVPQDQYEEAIICLKNKIAEGKVPGVSNPDDAIKMIKKGQLTYKQALKIKKVATKESLAFDVATQAQVAGFIGGISAGLAFYSAKKAGLSNKEASATAAKEFGKSGGKILVSGVATQQFLRSEAGRKVAAITTHVVRKGINGACDTNVGRNVIEKFSQGVCGKMVNGSAARTIATKAIRGNIITSAVVFAVDSIPDTYRLCTGKMSAKEFGKSRAVGAAGVAAGSVGYMAGMAIGTAICPGVGTAIGGFVGGILGGIGGNAGAQKVFRGVKHF